MVTVSYLRLAVSPLYGGSVDGLSMRLTEPSAIKHTFLNLLKTDVDLPDSRNDSPPSPPHENA
jgi:hypothetical protein